MGNDNNSSKLWSLCDMKNKEYVMTPEQVEISIRHSKNNIVRSVVLMKRAVSTLTFADKSLEGTKMIEMPGDISNAKRYIADALRTLEKYIE